MPDRLPPPGPSFLRDHEVRVRDRTYRAGMARPSDAPDGWWLTIMWVADDEGIVSFRDVAPAAGPPPDPPLARLGPALAGALSGLILEDGGRLQLRVAGLVAPDDDTAVRTALESLTREGFVEAELDQIGDMQGVPDDEPHLSAYQGAVEGEVSIVTFEEMD